MLVYTEEASRSAELARELNAVYGLLEFARVRCYPQTLTARLHALLQSCQSELQHAENSAAHSHN